MRFMVMMPTRLLSMDSFQWMLRLVLRGLSAVLALIGRGPEEMPLIIFPPLVAFRQGAPHGRWLYWFVVVFIFFKKVI